jgi:hypothetical protein
MAGRNHLVDFLAPTTISVLRVEVCGSIIPSGRRDAQSVSASTID